MNKGKSIISIFLCAGLILFGLIGCNTTGDNNSTSPSENSGTISNAEGTSMTSEPFTQPNQSGTSDELDTSEKLTSAIQPTPTEPPKTEPTIVESSQTKSSQIESSRTESSQTEESGYLSKSDTSVEPVRNLAEIKIALSGSDLICDKYDLEKYIRPFWQGNIVYNESVTFYRDASGRAAAPLLYDIAEILSVKSSDLKTTYQEGVDYTIENGMLVLPENSSIPCFQYRDLYFNIEKSGWSWALKKGGYTLFQEGTYFHSRQIAVTYLHTQPWKGYKPAFQESMLPQIISKLKAGDDVTIVYLGDSITKGGNASGMFGTLPNMPIWTDMVTTALKQAYPESTISTYSASENGATTVQAIKNLRQLCSDHSPDLVIIGFGMNDGSDADITPARFQENIQSIMEMNDLLTQKTCDYILLSTSLPNQEVKLGNANTQNEHSEMLFELEKRGTATTGGVVVGDMTAIHFYMLESKRFIDMTGNNINHPNDFLVRAYAQLVCKLLIE
ncbi:MAG: SGNH/GDSL hydrolase family protein [Prolixibacteraceae bacterium]|nr:SGNH/GDSL hydrolase family protein [Prolixibacteraceae bacterium]